MNRPLPQGLWPVMLTSFKSDGSIDWNGIDAITDWYISSGAVGLFACCLSSEMYTLTPNERLRLTRRVSQRSNGRVPIVAPGTFGGDLGSQAEFIKQMADTGVTAVVVIPNQLVAENEGEEILRNRIERLLLLTDSIPLGLYECPLQYTRLISPDTLRYIAPTGRFLYLKSISSNVELVRFKIEAVRNTPLGLFNANTPTALTSLQNGAAGLSPISANYFPELFSWLCDSFHDCSEKTRSLQRMLTLMESITPVKYPASAKYFLQQRGLPIHTKCRVGKIFLSRDDTMFLDNLGEIVLELIKSNL
ncbi:dihydrodipicolinate synthase family protein [Chloroflexota bacterium]